MKATISSKVLHDMADTYAYIDQQEIGNLSIRINGNNFSIFLFHVNSSVRKSGVGRDLLNEMVSIIKQKGGTELTVFPQTESHDGEPDVDVETLYEIYQHLGFKFKDFNPLSRSHKMVLEINS